MKHAIKKVIHARLTAIVLAALFIATAAVGQSELREQSGGGASALEPSIGPAQPVQEDLLRIWKGLEGTYEATTKEGRLRIVLKPVTRYSLYMEWSGTLDGDRFDETGYLVVSAFQFGSRREIALSYRPRYFARRFTCGFIGTPEPDGFQVETNGSDCSFPLRRSVSQWKLEEHAGQILVTDTKSGDVTRLVRVSAS
jgi:hypothetical protein